MSDANFKEANDYEPVDVSLQVGSRTIVARIISPAPADLAEDPALLLHFTGPKEQSLYEDSYAVTTRQFLDAGHRVASFDLPSHGTRVDHFGESLTGFCNAFVAGQDPFLMFNEEAIALINHCIAQGLVRPERIVACGTSRAGYMSLRLMAAEPRIAAVAAIAPVTDWRVLTEFDQAAGRPDVAALHLANFAEGMVGRPVYMVIGNHDARVSTVACCELFGELVRANERRGYDDSLITFQVLEEVGHFSPESWHRQGGSFLLEQMAAQRAVS